MHPVGWNPQFTSNSNAPKPVHMYVKHKRQWLLYLPSTINIASTCTQWKNIQKHGRCEETEQETHINTLIVFCLRCPQRRISWSTEPPTTINNCDVAVFMFGSCWFATNCRVPSSSPCGCCVWWCPGQSFRGDLPTSYLNAPATRIDDWYRRLQSSKWFQVFAPRMCMHLWYFMIFIPLGIYIYIHMT